MRPSPMMKPQPSLLSAEVATPFDGKDVFTKAYRSIAKTLSEPLTGKLFMSLGF